jgi:hypothetical protein
MNMPGEFAYTGIDDRLPLAFTLNVNGLKSVA